MGKETVKSIAIEKLTETEVHSAITTLDVEVVGQAQLMGDPQEVTDSFTPGEEWDMRVKIDVWPEAIWTAPWDDGSLEVAVEREAKDQSASRAAARGGSRRRRGRELDSVRGDAARPRPRAG